MPTNQTIRVSPNYQPDKPPLMVSSPTNNNYRELLLDYACDELEDIQDGY